ncbi:unannotated protein [freshwater metagenome]|uniref:Unannotated protein n=1 Tax=freshwater metagenome TaxID=449393 RepID=A0A6J6GRB1_9ZZZZ|nr:amidohydrolase family protein [Actinomycetota bacterium]
MNQFFDIAISGLIYDGRGNTPQQLNIGIKDGLIAFVGKGAIEAGRKIDATGLAVAPGFIDVHTHSDVSLYLDGRGQSKAFQGVTTEVTGNCSFSAFPINPDYKQQHADFLTGIGDDRIEIPWVDVEGYRSCLEGQGIAINIAPLVGHGTLRIAAMGLKEGDASESELETMRSLLKEMLTQGAFGMSTGLTYVPSRYGSFSELEALCLVLQSQDRIYTSHARDYDILGDDLFLGPLKEQMALARKTFVRIQYSHAAINSPSLWGSAKKWTDFFQTGISEGLDAAFDVYPYDASSSALTQYLPAWVQEGGVTAMAERLADKETMARAAKELLEGWSAQKIPWLWDRFVFARTDGLLGVVPGDSIEVSAKKLNIAPELLVLELCRLGGNGVMVVLFYRTEEDMRTFANSDYSMICSDGSAFPFDQKGRLPHPRSFGASVRALGRLCRELGDMPLERAIFKMTGKAAQHFKIHDRGTIEVGKAADIVIFDPATVKDMATFIDPAQPPLGITCVIVNGEIVIEDGQQNKVLPGKVLRAKSLTTK